MSRMKNITLTVAAGLLLLPGISRAEAGKVGLQEAFGLALSGNPRLVAMESSLKAGREKVGAARSYILPKITLEERFMKTDNPTYAFSSKLNQSRFEAADFAIDSLNDPDAIDDFTTSISFQQALYSRQASLGVKMARTASEALEYDYQRAREQVLLNVLESFIAGETTRGYLDVALQGQDDARTHLEITRSRVEAGLGLESDLLRARVSVQESEERLVSARKNVSMAARTLGLVLGLEGPIEADEESIPISSLRPLEYYEEASATRRDLVSMSKAVENAGLNIRMAAAPFTPTVGLGGSYQINSHSAPLDDEGSSYQVMAFVRWDLYSGGLKGHAASEARYGLKEAEAYYDGLKKEIAYRISEAYLAVLEATRGIELASSRLSLAEETARLIEKRYQNSLATVVELLDAQSSLDSARANLVARKNAHLVFMAKLMFQSGLIEQEYLVEN